MRPTPIHALLPRIFAIMVVVAACGGGAGTAPPPPTSTATAAASATGAPGPTTGASAAATLPDDLHGTWSGTEADFDAGVTWASTYRIGACSLHAEVWKAPTKDQVCGDWAGTTELGGSKASCSGTLSWAGTKGDGWEFVGSAPPKPIGGEWSCNETWRIVLTPDGAAGMKVDTFIDGNPSTSGTLTQAPGS